MRDLSPSSKRPPSPRSPSAIGTMPQHGVGSRVRIRRTATPVGEAVWPARGVRGPEMVVRGLGRGARREGGESRLGAKGTHGQARASVSEAAFGANLGSCLGVNVAA